MTPPTPDLSPRRRAALLHERVQRFRRRHGQAAGLALAQHGDRLLRPRQVGAGRAVGPQASVEAQDGQRRVGRAQRDFASA